MPKLFVAQPNIKQLVSVTEEPDGTFSLTMPLGSSAGAISANEVTDPTNGSAISTVPSGKTFTGLAIVVARLGSGGGSVAVSAATGGVKAHVSSPAATSAAQIAVVPVTIAGGSGNAVTAVTSGTITSSTVALVGHIA